MAGSPGKPSLVAWAALNPQRKNSRPRRLRVPLEWHHLRGLVLSAVASLRGKAWPSRRSVWSRQAWERLRRSRESQASLPLEENQ